MKKFFIFLNIMLTSCVGLLIYTHVSHEPPAPDRELTMTPDTPDHEYTGVFNREIIPSSGDLSHIYENNIFLTNRGIVNKKSSEAGNVSKKYRGHFKVSGICKMADVQGAVISSSAMGKIPALKSRFFRVTEKIGETGYKLVEVSPAGGTVVVSNGTIREVLTMEKNDSDSIKRRNDAVKEQQKAVQDARSHSILQNKTKTTNTPKNIPRSQIKKTPSSHKAQTPAEKAAIRKKILERMAKERQQKQAAAKRK